VTALFDPLGLKPLDRQGHITSSDGFLKTAQPKPIDLKQLGIAAGAIAFGFAMSRLKTRLPVLAPAKSFIPTDWKTYAQIAAGVIGVRSFNKGIGVQPPAWATAVETTALLHPMTLGMKGKALKHLPVMAAYVASVVGGTNWAVNKFDDAMGNQMGIPRWVPKVLLWGTAVLGGAKFYPAIARQVAKTGLLGKAMKREAHNGSAFVKSAVTGGGAAAGVMCANGCCPAAICAVEVGDALGSLFSGHLATHPHEKNRVRQAALKQRAEATGFES
jgi:hypothetical protein